MKILTTHFRLELQINEEIQKIMTWLHLKYEYMNAQRAVI